MKEQTDNIEQSGETKTTGDSVTERTTVQTPFLSESPVLSALRSHMEKWYPETVKNRLEKENILEGTV